MKAKNVDLNEIMINGISMGADITSASYYLGSTEGYSIQAVWTGTNPVGDITYQISNDDINWTSMTPISVASNAGNNLLDVTDHNYLFIRATYKFTSGTGTLNVRLITRSHKE